MFAKLLYRLIFLGWIACGSEPKGQGRCPCLQTSHSPKGTALCTPERAYLWVVNVALRIGGPSASLVLPAPINPLLPTPDRASSRYSTIHVHIDAWLHRMEGYLVSIVIFTAIFTIFGLGLNLQWGFTGLINFGHVAFMAIGAYATVLLAEMNVPLWIAASTLR